MEEDWSSDSDDSVMYKEEEKFNKVHEVRPMSRHPEHGWQKLKPVPRKKAFIGTTNNMKQILIHAWANDAHKDLKIRCKGGRSVKCHSAVMAISSPMLKSMIDEGKETIVLPDFSVDAVTLFLKMCYSLSLSYSCEDEETFYELEELLETLDIDLSEISVANSDMTLMYDEEIQDTFNETRFVKILNNEHFDEVTSLAKNKRKKDLPSRERIQCDKCPLVIPKSDMKRHQSSHHDPNLPFECSFCYFRNVTQKSIVFHETKHHFNLAFGKNGVNKESREKYEAQSRYDLQSGFKMKCKLCPLTFFPTYEETHLRDHHDPNLPHKCPFCGFKSVYERAILLHENQYHYKEKHGKEKKIILCKNGCGKDFSTLNHMRTHSQRYCPLSKVKEELIKKERSAADWKEKRALQNMLKRKNAKKRQNFLKDNQIDVSK